MLLLMCALSETAIRLAATATGCSIGTPIVASIRFDSPRG